MAQIDLHTPPFVLLDDSRAIHQAGRSFFFHSPDQIICARTFAEVPAALEVIDQLLEQGYHLAGWIAYECGAVFEPRLAQLMVDLPEEPLIWMMATHHREVLSSQDVAALFDQHSLAEYKVSLKQDNGQSAKYTQAFEAVQHYITSGDVYQVNYTFPLPFRLEGDALAFYAHLRTKQPVPLGSFIHTGETCVLSLSPELFIRRDGTRLVSHPMKGTAARGRTPAEDEAIAKALTEDEKSCAENLMIVDLIRNDLSRLALPASVKVDRLFYTEKFPTLHQMSSAISAQVADGLKPSELLKALFPCGSITGTPKVRAMEIINSLEEGPRGVYCGAVGHFSPVSDDQGHDWNLNVPIRTLVMKADGDGRLSVGSGVVADSNGQNEYEECLLKAHFLTEKERPFSLLETLKLDGAGEYAYLKEHLSRLKASAGYFDFPFDEDAIVAALTALADEHARQTLRVRLLLDRKGEVELGHTPLMLSQNEEGLVCLSEEQINPEDIFLFHKTTNRTLYNEAYQKAQAGGYADILFLNERGEVTEGAISTLFVEVGGKWYTPPVQSGLLPGVLRAAMLSEQSPPLEERVITCDDLAEADALYIGNSVRGLRRVTLDPIFL